MSANQPPENTNSQPADNPPVGTSPPVANNPTAGSNQPPVAPQFTPADQSQQPAAAGYPPAAGTFVPQAPPAPKKSGMLRRILFTVGGAIIAIVIGVLVRNGVFDTASMKAGDCVQQTGSDSVKVVACDSPDAQYRVLGIVEKQSQISARMGACKEFPDTTSVYWEGRDTNSGTVYCLQQL